MRAIDTAFLAIAFGTGLVGCSAAVGDLGGFTEDVAACRQDADRNRVRDLEFDLAMMTPHVSHYFEFMTVDSRTGQLRSRYIMEPLGAPALTVFVEDFIPPGDQLEIQFYADITGDRLPSPFPNDHTWVRPVCSDGVQYFEHIFEFEPIEFLPLGSGSFVVQLTNVPTELRTHVVESRLVHPGESRTIAGFRRAIAGEMGDLEVPLVADAGTEYVALVYFDADGDGEPTAGDRFCGFRQTAPADGSNLTIAIDVDAALETAACDLSGLDPEDVP